jgi:hypothetical protein
MALCYASDAGAQICDGRAAFDLAPAQLGFHTGWTSRGHVTGMSIGAGSDRLFAIGSVESQALVDSPAYRLTATVGTNQPLRLDNRLHLCPILGAAYTRRPDTNMFGVAGGGSMGVVAKNSAALVVIPTLSVRIRPVFGDTSRAFAGLSSEPPATLNFGVGLLILNRISFMPSAALELARAHTTAGLQVAVSYNFPRR